MPPRIANYPIEPLFLERWSPRAFVPEAISDEQLATLLEAARWAPSAFNAQPWRFLYARRDTPDWQRFLDILVPFNQSWVQHSSLILFSLSDTLMQAGPDAEAKPSHSHSFDAGAGWALLALQATRLGLAAHGMTGVDFDRARADLAIPDRFRVECAIAVGKPGDKSTLPEQLQGREGPSDRNGVETFAFAGSFPNQEI